MNYRERREKIFGDSYRVDVNTYLRLADELEPDSPLDERTHCGPILEGTAPPTQTNYESKLSKNS